MVQHGVSKVLFPHLWNAIINPSILSVRSILKKQTGRYSNYELSRVEQPTKSNLAQGALRTDRPGTQASLQALVALVVVVGVVWWSQ